ncbi:DUF418 domain-containing protein [Natronincola ferrireducens]|uniref:DUF418 domain-containing protein n=1 Tax=Natronincola ferrireducens TaxID=393762 RepID=A0A1G8Z8X1_9FIRM|nr:DUF418 domain-containing protein [Natronincola ferrireducens]SDK11522.1 uncharacterized protein SAMN05660472_00775 [Natronincola ferrireducens]
MHDSNSAQLQPVSEQSRVKEIDIIRGFALFGVLLVNVVFFSYVTIDSLTSGIHVLSYPLNLSNSTDRILAIFIKLFAEGKFYTIFSILFGLGFYIFIKKVEEKGFSPKSLFRRRLLLLMLFGVLNLFLVWFGDILHVYALIGFILLAFRNKSIKSLKRWIVILLIISTLLMTISTPSPLALRSHFGDVDYFSYSERVERSFDIYENGSYFEIIRFRITNDLPFVLISLLFTIPKILGMFLIGLLLAKLKIFHDIKGNLHLIKKMWKTTGALSVLSTLICIIMGYIFLPSLVVASLFFGLFFELGTVFLSLFYITSLLLLLRKDTFIKILAPLQWVGRMALTNYLVQCILCSFVFYGQGLGLITNMGILAGVLFTVVIFSLQVIFSKVWFDYYKFGPLEWVWRKYTYSKV